MSEERICLRTNFKNVGNATLRAEYKGIEGLHDLPDWYLRVPLDAKDAAHIANKAFEMGYEEALRERARGARA